jgi:hypothetical protein
MNQFKLTLLCVSALFVSGLRKQFSTANVEGAAGTHGPGAFTRRADVAFTKTNLLCKAGTDAGHVDICGAADYPVGISTDEAAAAEDLMNVAPLGSSTQGTRKFRCTTALGANIDLYTAAGGVVVGEPGSAGTYYKVARSVAAAQIVGTSDYMIEAAPIQPIMLVVAAAPSTVGNIATAMAAPALIKFLP